MTDQGSPIAGVGALWEGPSAPRRVAKQPLPSPVAANTALYVLYRRVHLYVLLVAATARGPSRGCKEIVQLVLAEPWGMAEADAVVNCMDYRRVLRVRDTARADASEDGVVRREPYVVHARG